jgi:hypothetical protein
MEQAPAGLSWSLSKLLFNCCLMAEKAEKKEDEDKKSKKEDEGARGSHQRL